MNLEERKMKLLGCDLCADYVSHEFCLANDVIGRKIDQVPQGRVIHRSNCRSCVGIFRCYLCGKLVGGCVKPIDGCGECFS